MNEDKDKALATKWIRAPFGPFPTRLDEGPDEYLEHWRELVIERIASALATVRREAREEALTALVVHLQATADALDVKQETECPSGTAFNSEALLRRRIAFEIDELKHAADSREGENDG